MKLLAMDIGASGGRAIMGELGGGRLTLSEIHRFRNETVERHGHRHWDVERLRSELLAALRKAGPEPESVGIDTWGVDYGYVGREGEVMEPPFAYRDTRTTAVIDDVHRVIPRQQLYEITGLQFLPFNTIYQMAEDVRSRPDVLAEADRMLMMPELLSYLLTGRYAAEYTIASTSGLLDARTRTWSEELLEAVGLPPRLFTEVSAPGAHRAEIRADIAAETGCRAVVICPACHDTASAVAATPLEGAGDMYISSGTWSLAGMEVDEPIVTEGARAANFTNEGGVGGKIRFLKNVMGLWLVQELQRVWAVRGGQVGFSEIVEAARAAGPFGALVNPNLRRFLAPADMEAEIGSECRRTGQAAPEGVGPLARCVFESLAFAYRESLEQLQELTGRRVGRVHIVGGGVQNKLLCQMTADACGVRVCAGPVEATAIGNVLVQAIALGAVAELGEARRIVSATFAPEEYVPQDTAAWEAGWERYRALGAAAGD